MAASPSPATAATTVGSSRVWGRSVSRPARRDLAAALVRLLDHGWGIDGASDHGAHEAIYLHDPDGNGLELAWDRDPSEWRALRQPLDFDSLLAELGDGQGATYLLNLRAYR